MKVATPNAGRNMPSNKTLSFQVFKGPKLLKKADFTEESVTIGSGDSAVLCIPDSGLADLHAVINVDDDGSVHLFDLGTDTGVKVNGEIVSNATLKSGSAVSAGDVKILVTWKAAPAPLAGEFDDVAPTQVGEAPNATMAGLLDDDATDPGKAAASPPVATPAPAPTIGKPKAAAAPRVSESENTAAPVAAPKISAPAPVKPTPAAPPPAAPPVAAHADVEEDDQAEEHDDHHGPDEPPEDVIAILIRGAQHDAAMKGKNKILEVNQIWGEALLDAKQYMRRPRSVSIGASIRHPWKVLGFTLFSVPEPLNHVMQYVPPGISSCESEWDNDFFAPPQSLPETHDYDLITDKGGKFIVHAAAKWDGFVDIGETRYNSFEEAVAAGMASKTDKGYDIPMSDDTRVAVDIEGMVFFTQMVHPGRKAMASMTNNVDWLFLGITTLLMCFVSIFAVLVYLAPPRSETSEVSTLDDRYVELLMEKPEPEKKKGGNPDAGEGAKAKKEEGKVGKKDAKMEKAKGDKVQMKKQEMDRQVVENAGIMGAMSDDALSSTLGASGLSADIQGGIGGLIGTTGVQIGSGGLGARGSGIGGGGTAEGLGGLGTKGSGSGASGFGSGGGNFGQKGEGGIAGVGGDPIVIGALDRALIDEVIKRHMNHIRYCYQRELTKNPALSGKVVIKFTIAKDGTVSSASTKSTTMNNQAVEQCIEGRFMRMTFPQPKGGGIVIVSYPFMFSPG